ncbi:MAG: ribosome recycling factor [Elusimicrobiales bacterium]
MDANTGVSAMMAKLDKGMAEHVERLRKEMGTLRTGRANPQLVEGIKAECYGSLMPLKQLGAISVPDGRTIEIQPWDPSSLEAIEKALQKSDLGASPVNNGKLVRISIPQMTEDRRKQLVKTIKTMAEEFKVKLRNERRDAVERVKKAQKTGEISEDDCKRFEQAIQKATDSFTKKVDEVISEKEKELLSV